MGNPRLETGQSVRPKASTMKSQASDKGSGSGRKGEGVGPKIGHS